MALVDRQFTTKEIAHQLDISPNSVDRRIDAVRHKFGDVSRGEAVRLWRQGKPPEIKKEGEKIPPETFPITPTAAIAPAPEMPREELELADGYQSFASFDDRPGTWRMPELRPQDLGTVARIFAMLGIAVLGFVLWSSGVDLVHALGNALSR